MLNRFEVCDIYVLFCKTKLYRVRKRTASANKIQLLGVFNNFFSKIVKKTLIGAQIVQGKKQFAKMEVMLFFFVSRKFVSFRFFEES